MVSLIGAMIVLPVIERELRAAARNAVTYNLRVLGALGLVGVLGAFWLRDTGGSGVGARLFGDFQQTLFFVIWILVPLLTADCISRERREGTLPLLFLTPLTAGDIVRAKGLAHGLRSFTLWLAVLPVFTVCFLGGGVDWSQVMMSVLVNFSSVCLALGAGLVASARTRVWTRALAMASGLAFCFLTGFVLLLPWFLAGYWAISFGRPVPGLSEFSQAPEVGLLMTTNIQQVCQSWFFRRGPGAVVGAYALFALFSALAFCVLMQLAGSTVKRTWQERPSTPGVLWLKEKLFKPVLFRKQLRAWLRWQLQHNPIGWLEQRSWSGRLVVWSWFAIVVCVYSSLFANLGLYQRGFHFLQTVLAAMLATSMAVSAAGSFRRERESGVLELLLVAPLREWQILLGRLRGLWSQFLPAIVLLCSVWLYVGTFLSTRNEWPSVVGYLVTFATIPLVGLYFSLAKPNFMAALVWTVLVQVVLPAAVLLAARFDYKDESGLADVMVPALVQVAVALFLGWRLLVMLKRREFVKTVN